MEKSTKVRVMDDVGLHVRTASVFASVAKSYDSDILIGYNGKQINGKSMLNIMSLGVKTNDVIDLLAKGEDAEEAIDSLKRLVENDFKI